jgi:hypothetical protein
MHCDLPTPRTEPSLPATLAARQDVELHPRLGHEVAPRAGHPRSLPFCGEVTPVKPLGNL